MTTDRVFISWISYSRRSELIAGKLGMRLHLISSLRRRPYLAPLRYLLQAVRTLTLLLRERPRLVFVQNPPIFAPLVVYLYTRLSGARFVIDAHSTALLAPTWHWARPLHGFLSRRAEMTIVTNQHLADMITAWGATPFILADIPAQLPPGRPYATHGAFNVGVVNTFAPDEPVPALLEAAASLPDVHFYISGDLRRANKAVLSAAPANVHFTGFLPDEDYLGLLRAVQAVAVLTTRDHTMQRGACEAIALGKPVLTSDWPLLRAFFHMGTVHVDNSCSGIQLGIRRLQRDLERLTQEAQALKEERNEEWRFKEAELSAQLRLTEEVNVAH